MVLAQITNYPSPEGSEILKEIFVSPFLVQKLINLLISERGLVSDNSDLCHISIHFINILE